MRPTRFVLFGVAGFVARRHLEAIRQVGGELVAAVDPHDSVGILDRYALGARYFQREDECSRHLARLREVGQGIDYVVVCSPNHLHGAHIELGLRAGAHVICEKPLVISLAELTRVEALSRELGRRIYPVLQLRYHPALLSLASEPRPRGERVPVALDYVTPRGAWYDQSWKGDDARSGGLLANIGVHFLDALLWLFGPVVSTTVTGASSRTIRGELLLERAHVEFRLSIDAQELEASVASDGKPRSRRQLSVQGRHIGLEADLEGLHDRVYAAIVSGTGLGLEQARPALELCFALARKATASVPHGETAE